MNNTESRSYSKSFKSSNNDNRIVFKGYKQHQEIISKVQILDCKLLNKSFKVNLWTFNTIAERHKINYNNVKALICDVQGAELKVLQGSTNLLQSPCLQWIIPEVSWKPIYKDGCQIEELDAYLSTYGFKRVYTEQELS